LLQWIGIKYLSLQHASGLSRVVLTIFVTLAIYALSAAIWKFYDLPINKRRSKWVSARYSSAKPITRAVEAEPVAP
jgi:peptidoglycan/LPS O-acetylase OafA/YrhL